MERQLKMRVLIAKPGLGGHDRRAAWAAMTGAPSRSPRA